MRFKILGLIFTFIFVSCKKPDEPRSGLDPVKEYLNLPASPFNYANQNLPAYMAGTELSSFDNTPAHNPITNHGATLGRVLFYEKALSKSNTIACASCHKQEQGFSDNIALSEGWEGHKTKRHSMALVNAKYYRTGKFFWDERAATLEEQVLMPIQDSVEMGLTLTEMETRLNNLPYYKPLFYNAFGSDEITTEKAALALAQFVRSIVSYQTKYDEGRAQVSTLFEPFPNFTEGENKGKQLFNGFNDVMCVSCHGTEALVADEGRNNGLDLSTTDLGIGGISGNPSEVSEFKTPSLKNIMLTAPYMHDGRFATIEEVLEHYNSGIENHPTLDPELKNLITGLPRPMNMTAKDKQALIAFLHTLTDSVLVKDQKFSNPF